MAPRSLSPVFGGQFDGRARLAMELTVVEEGGIRLVEGRQDEQCMWGVDDAARVVEACISAGVASAVLYPANLTRGFFDLSSGEEGAVLQKLRNCRARLAVVCAPGSVHFSSRFGEVVAEEGRGRYFGLFETRAEAIAWLGKGPLPKGGGAAEQGDEADEA